MSYNKTRLAPFAPLILDMALSPQFATLTPLQQARDELIDKQLIVLSSSNAGTRGCEYALTCFDLDYAAESRAEGMAIRDTQAKRVG